MSPADQSAPAPTSPTPEVIARHSLATRLTHWINVVCFIVLLMSGLQILNAHPALYWGQFGADDDRPVIAFSAEESGDTLIGRTHIGPLHFVSTGLLGVSRGSEGGLEARGVPAWATIPSFRDLATGRRWHFAFAWIFVINGLVYVTTSLVSGHFRRDLVPTRQELQPRHLLQDLWDHARLKFPRGEAAKRYNVLQKLAYLGAIGLLILMVMTGLTMSPGIDARAPWLPELFGGRPSARTVHFLSAASLVAFLFIHLAMVVLVGPINEIRAMITGRYVVPKEAHR